MFGRVTFIPTLVYNMFMQKVSSRQWYNRIDQHVLLGALPWKSIAPELIKQEKVAGVVSMNEDYELFSWVADARFWTEHQVRFLQLSTPDIFNAPSLHQLIQGVEFIEQIANDGLSVYVHCKAGRTRSATLVACYLINRYQLTPKQAESLMEERRPHIFLRQTQYDAIDEYYHYVQKQKKEASS